MSSNNNNNNKDMGYYYLNQYTIPISPSFVKWESPVFRLKQLFWKIVAIRNNTSLGIQLKCSPVDYEVKEIKEDKKKDENENVNDKKKGQVEVDGKEKEKGQLDGEEKEKEMEKEKEKGKKKDEDEIEKMEIEGIEENWSVTLQGLMRLVNHLPSNIPQYKLGPLLNHTFSDAADTFSYDHFTALAEILDINNGWINDGKIILEISLITDYNLLAVFETAYLGLKNNGSTCYMLALLQILFYTNILRRAVYDIPTENDVASLAFCLQRIFYEMQFSNHSVDIKNLTYLCNNVSPYVQEDAHETLRAMLNKLQDIMQDAGCSNVINNLFRGSCVVYVICTDIDKSSLRNQAYYDLSLNITTSDNIYGAIEEYTRKELLEGVDRYMDPEYGLQRAWKGVAFTSFPPILHLHILRFGYDRKLHTSVKNNDYFQFYRTINLDRFLMHEGVPRLGDYILHAVLVHVGEVNCGHYVTYIDPKANGNWYKFDDHIVSKCTEDEAIKDNYGGTMRRRNVHNNSNAYLLVYIRKSELGRVLQDVTQYDISFDLAARIELETAFEELNLKHLMQKEESPSSEFTSLEIDKGYVTSITRNEQKTYIKKALSNISKVMRTPAPAPAPAPITAEKDPNFNIIQALETITNLIHQEEMSNSIYEFLIHWIETGSTEERYLTLLMGYNDTAREIVEMARNYIKTTVDFPARLGLLIIEDNQIVAICSDEILLRTILNTEPMNLASEEGAAYIPQRKYRVEYIPEIEELELLVSVFHFKKSVLNTFGLPFLMKIFVGESFSYVKERIQNRLNLSDKEFKEIKVILPKMGGKLVEVQDELIVTNLQFPTFFQGQLPFLGLAHPEQAEAHPEQAEDYSQQVGVYPQLAEDCYELDEGYQELPEGDECYPEQAEIDEGYLDDPEE